MEIIALKTKSDGQSLIFVTNHGDKIGKEVTWDEAFQSEWEFMNYVDYLYNRFSHITLRLLPHRCGQTVLPEDDLSDIVNGDEHFPGQKKQMVGLMTEENYRLAIILIPTPEHPYSQGYYDYQRLEFVCKNRPDLGAEKFFLRALYLEEHPEARTDRPHVPDPNLFPCKLCNRQIVPFFQTWCGFHICGECANITGVQV